VLNKVARLIFNPYAPCVLLCFSLFNAVFGTPTWRTYAAAICGVIWLVLEIRELRSTRSTIAAASDDQTSALGLPPVGSPAHAQLLREAIQMVHRIQEQKNAPPPPVPTVDEIRATALPAISLQRAPLPVPLAHPGRSYIGGLPRLPSQLEWPERERYERFALTFLAQIDLAELPSVDGSLLPRSGVLYFFMNACTDSPEPTDCCVLYWPDDVTSVAIRDLPANAPTYGYGGEPWPWLPKDSVWSHVAFRFPLQFVAFTSYRDFYIDEDRRYPPPRNEAGLNEVMAEEFRKSFGAREAPPGDMWLTIGEDRDDWAFSWIAVEYGARALIYAIDDKLRFKPKAAEAAAEFQELKLSAEKWIHRASAETSFAPSDAATRTEFVTQWRVLCAEANRVAERVKVYGLEPKRTLSQVIAASCYFCASNGAQDIIPEVYRRAFTQLSDPLLTFREHQMLGHGEPVQSAPHDRHNEILLLQLKGDEALGWHSNIGCVLQFWITPEALERRDFSGVEVTLECD
jgi:uncharacterized protein YwqG